VGRDGFVIAIGVPGPRCLRINDLGVADVFLTHLPCSRIDTNRVRLTTHPLLQAIIPLVADIAREMPSAERYRRLLEALRVLLPCDAAALLRLQDDWLLPLAVDGLSGDTLGRRFRVAEHPRFAALLEAVGLLRFPCFWYLV